MRCQQVWSDGRGNTRQRRMLGLPRVTLAIEPLQSGADVSGLVDGVSEHMISRDNAGGSKEDGYGCDDAGATLDPEGEAR